MNASDPLRVLLVDDDTERIAVLRSGLASIAVTKAGTIQIGQWGRDLNWSPDIVAVRQNAVLRRSPSFSCNLALPRNLLSPTVQHL